MKHRDIVLAFLLPADQNPAESIEPAMCTLHHPAACSAPKIPFEFLRFLPPRLDVGDVPESLDQVAHLAIIVPLIQTKVLPVKRSWLWRNDRHAQERFFHQLHVMPIGTRHSDAQHLVGSVTQHTSFDAAFVAIRRVSAGFPPSPKGALVIAPSIDCQRQSIP